MKHSFLIKKISNKGPVAITSNLPGVLSFFLTFRLFPLGNAKFGINVILTKIMQHNLVKREHMKDRIQVCAYLYINELLSISCMNINIVNNIGTVQVKLLL